jgi:hypothetical protein
MSIMHVVFNNFWDEYMPAVGALLQRNYTQFSQQSARLFPIQAKCMYYNFGPSGGRQEHDALCFLPQNTVNEKLFAVLYIWLIAVLVLALLNLTYLILMMSCKWLRVRNMKRLTNRRVSMRYKKFYGDFGYWFTLHLLDRNLSPVLFVDLISDLMEHKE